MGLHAGRVLAPGVGRSDSPMPDQAYIAGDGVASVTCDSVTYTVDINKFNNPVVGIGGCTNVTGINGFTWLYNSGNIHSGQPDTLTANKVLQFGDAEYTAVAEDDFIHGHGLVKVGDVIVNLDLVDGYTPINTGTTLEVINEGGLVFSGQLQVKTAADPNHSITATLEAGDEHTIRAGGGQIIAFEGVFEFTANSGNPPVIIDSRSSGLQLPLELNSGNVIKVFGGTVSYYDTTS